MSIKIEEGPFESYVGGRSIGLAEGLGLGNRAVS